MCVCVHVHVCLYVHMILKYRDLVLVLYSLVPRLSAWHKLSSSLRMRPPNSEYPPPLTVGTGSSSLRN